MKRTFLYALLPAAVLGAFTAAGMSSEAETAPAAIAHLEPAEALADADLPAGDYIGLDGHSEPLRGSFNADVGKVRILMLVAPT